MQVVLRMYITLMPVIFAGILTMIWCKGNVMQWAAKPLDQGVVLRDGQRLFGENKTWKGFLGYLIWGSFSSLSWGWLCHSLPFLEENNYLYQFHQNSWSYNLLTGFLFGLAYALCELPNSFLKRRFQVQPGKPAKGIVRGFFFVLDQVDSLFGCVFVLVLFYPMSFSFYLAFVFLGGLTHILVNIGLYQLKLRKNIF